MSPLVVLLAIVACVVAQTEYCYNRNGCTYTTGKATADTNHYKSPYSWGEISETCLNGRSQSPINFRQQDITYRPDFDQIVLNYGNLVEPTEPTNANPPPANPITFPSAIGDQSVWAWSPNPTTRLWSTGVAGLENYRRGSPHAIQMFVPADQRLNFRMSGGPLPEPSYNLDNIIFRLPSEHQVEGVSHSMEVQLIHSAVDSAGVTQYAVLAVLFQVGEQESTWLKQFTDRPRPATRSFTGPGRKTYTAIPTAANPEVYNYENPKMSGAAYGDFSARPNEVVCAEGRLCAVVHDGRAVTVAATQLIGSINEVAAGTVRRQLFEFDPVSKVEARVLLKSKAYQVTRGLGANGLGEYLSIEDAVLGETWRYAGNDPIAFDTLLLGSEAPNDPRRITPFRFYKGSLSYPPCSENAWWVVTAVPQEMSVYQLGVFKKILGEMPNNRPVQNTNGRRVFSSWYKDDKNFNDVQYELDFKSLFQVRRGL